VDQVPEKAAIVDLDQVIWLDYVRLRNQAAVAQLHGLSQSAVSLAIRRYLDSIPEPEKRELRVRALARLEDLYQAHRDKALTSPRAASLVRAVIMDQAHLLGLAPREVRVEHSGEVGHTWEPGPTVAELLERWRAEGKLRVRGELTRLDQGAGSCPGS
jgi:hypothetical protein